MVPAVAAAYYLTSSLLVVFLAVALAVAGYFNGRAVRDTDERVANVHALERTINDQLGIDDRVRWISLTTSLEDFYVEGEQYNYRFVWHSVDHATEWQSGDTPNWFWETSGYRVAKLAPRPETHIRFEDERSEFERVGTTVFDPDEYERVKDDLEGRDGIDELARLFNGGDSDV
ncbi:hypothetical protein ACFQGT_00070 [Natrialbaceae archaeon GCM10025810]